jgi:hypothetical protein
VDLQAAEAAILFEGHTEFVCMFGGGSYETVMREPMRAFLQVTKCTRRT